MSESKHARSRRAALLGLLLQLAAFGVVATLHVVSGSIGALYLAWLLLGGAPLWFATLLVQRQRELAALELLDFEELRREKSATGGGEAMFGAEGAGALGYQAADTRLRWMLRWLLPVFALITGLYLLFFGYQLWRTAGARFVFAADAPLQNLPITLTVLAVLMLLMFLMSRYAAGLGRVAEWHLLRACGSYAFACAIAAAALLAALAAHWYGGFPQWERYFAYSVPVLMALLAAEILINVTADLYRPRKPGVEPRAAFDSRVLGLFSEPGGIANSIAEAINYQFGFEVSQSWFYQLLQRAFVPLLGAGALTLWLLTSVVIVSPSEHALIERWGRPLNPDKPLGPGLHFKMPDPIDIAYRYPTGVLHEMLIGYRDFDAQPKEDPDRDPNKPEVVLWSQEQHQGLSHFDFLIYPKDSGKAPAASRPAAQPDVVADVAETSQSVAVNAVRMVVSVQFKIAADRLAEYVAQVESPETTLRNIAWAEVVKSSATHTIDQLLGDAAGSLGEILKQRIAARAAEYKLGLDVVYVGVFNVHPDPTVAEAYRGVIDADQQRVGSIREALVAENQTLSSAAGDKRKARAFVLAIDEFNAAERAAQDAEAQLDGASSSIIEQLRATIDPLRPMLQDRAAAHEQLRRAEQAGQAIALEFEAGIGSNLRLRARAAEAAAVARAAFDKTEAELNEAIARLRSPTGATAEQLAAIVRVVKAEVARELWTQHLARDIAALEGAAAAKLSQGQAERWELEMRAESDLKSIQALSGSYRAAPNIFRAREYFESFAVGLQDKRKFVLGVDPNGRDLKIRVNSEDEASADITEMPERPAGPQ